MSQRKYTLDLFRETGMLGCKPIDAPMDLASKVEMEEKRSLVDKGRYQRLKSQDYTTQEGG